MTETSTFPDSSAMRAAAASKTATLIAADTVVDGGVSGNAELHIEGVVHGDVTVPHVFIGDGGQVDGAIKAESVEAHGRVTGSISAKQVKLHAGCHVDGDVTHELLTMEAGAIFQGRSLRLDRQAAASPVTSIGPKSSKTGAAA
jgi:cytoskeletal protein CcmA (bactofilin family)